MAIPELTRDLAAAPPGPEGLAWRDAIPLFESLSHPGRQAVFRCVCRGGPAGVSLADIARDVRTTGSALTLHLRALEVAKLVKALPARPGEGRGARFVPNLQAVVSLACLLLTEATSASPDPRLSALLRVLEETEGGLRAG